MRTFFADRASDLRYAARSLTTRPGFTAVAVITLALGIGANTAIFSVVYPVLLRPLPYPDPDELVWITTEIPQLRAEMTAGADYLDWRDYARSLDGIAAQTRAPVTLGDRERPERLRGARVSASFFPLLGTIPEQGRLLRREDERLPGAPVAVVTSALWSRLFGETPFDGQRLELDGESYEVVGVLREGFRHTGDVEAELFLPLVLDETRERARHQMESVEVVARLADGVAPEQARAELQTICDRAGLPDTFVKVVPLHERMVGEIRPALLVLFGAVGLVLLVACANVAHLLLARAASRQREMAVRTALGASRARVAGQLLTESVLLAGLGGLAGLAVAWGGLRLLLAFLPPDLGGGILQRVELGLDAPVLGFTLLLALATGVLFGLAPAFFALRSGVGEALKEAGRQTSMGRGRGRLNRALVAVEVALSVVLLVGAGLLVRSFLALVSVDPGFSSERVLTLALNIDPDHDGGLESPENQAVWGSFYRELLPRLEALPGVESAALGDVVPLTGFRRIAMGLQVNGVEPPPPDQMSQVAMAAVTPEYFRMLGIPLVDGRAFSETDRRGAAPVAMVNQAMVDQLFGGVEPVGRTITIRRDRPPITVVGVVENVQSEGLDQPVKAQLYRPLEQQPLPFVFAALHTSVDPASLTRAVEGVVRELNPTLPVSDVATLEDRLSSSVAQPRFHAVLLGLFALLALVLAAVGLYGVMVYLVTERRRELGVRMALGADRPGIVKMVLSQAFAMAAAGIVLGLAGAAGLSQLLESRLFGIQPLDPVTFAGIPLLLLAVVLLASLVPARRAVTVDPARVLRED